MPISSSSICANACEAILCGSVHTDQRNNEPDLKSSDFFLSRKFNIHVELHSARKIVTFFKGEGGCRGGNEYVTVLIYHISLLIILNIIKKWRCHQQSDCNSVNTQPQNLCRLLIPRSYIIIVNRPKYMMKFANRYASFSNGWGRSSK